MPNYVPGIGPFSARLMIVGEAPGFYEDEQGEPFVGPSGHLLNNILYELNYSRKDIYITNVVKYRPPLNNFAKLHEIGIDYEEQVNKLFEEIETINPNCILALGKEALIALTGYKNLRSYRGSILRCKNGRTKVVATYHPANFLRDNKSSVYTTALPYSALAYVKLDFQRAIEESNSPNFNLPTRKLEICRDSGMAHSFFNLYKDKEIAACDIESIKCVPSCISFAFNAHHAMSFPLMPGLLRTTTSSRDIAEIWKYIERALIKLGIIGQNFKYDTHKLEKPCGFTRPKLYADTAMMFHCLYPEFMKSLEFMVSILTKEPYYKDEYKEWDPTKDSYENVLLYNAKDAALTFECWQVLDKELQEDNLHDFYYNFYNHAHDIYTDIEDCGMLVDLQKRNELKLKYVNEIKKTQDWLDKITGRPLNVRSYPQIKRLCEEFLSLPKRSGYDEETLVAYMQNSIKKEEDEWKREVLKAVLRLRKLKLVKSNVLEARPDFDGRMRTQYNLNGTENGRTSTSKVDTKLTINRIVPTGLGFQTISKHGDIGSDVRYMFIPDPGHAFVNMDFSQAEPRIVAVLSEDWDLVDKFNKGIDVHSELASFISGKTQWDGKRAPDDVRFLGKTGRNAYNYNVGKRTFAQQVNTDADKFGIDVKISEWKAGEILKKVNMLHPKVVDVFHAQIKEHIDSTRTLVNPFGRRRQFFDRLEDSIYREGMAFIPQSTVRDQMLKLMIAFRKEFPELAKKICLEAHDALMIITPTDLIAPVAQFLLNWPKENPVDFSRCSLSRDFKLILPSEVEVSEKSYKDLRKYKPTA